MVQAVFFQTHSGAGAHPIILPIGVYKDYALSPTAESFDLDNGDGELLEVMKRETALRR
jgi:hypothetical protein